MKQYLITIITVLLTSSLGLKAQQDTVKREKYLYLSAGAPTIYAGMSYEHQMYQFKNILILPRVGFGMNIFKPSFGKEYNFHTGITTLTGNQKHKLEVGIGLIHYLMQQFDFDNDKNTIKYKPIIYSLLGYRYNMINKPISLKIAFTPIIALNKDTNTFFPLIDIGIGMKIK